MATTLLIIFIIFTFISLIYLQPDNISDKKQSIISKTSDISKPKFSINSSKQNISVTATQGNFLTEEEIMLEKNVVFKSEKFKIFTDNVLFNKESLIASSKNKSKFVSEKTVINSNGFDIIENGNIINFKGKTKLIFK